MVLVLLARNPTDSVTHGLLPAADRLGLTVRLLTDHPQQHQDSFDALGDQLGYRPPQIEACEVREVRAVLAALSERPPPAALLTNSDHLQAQNALAADYFGLPGKDWRSAIRARDKGLMRATLHQGRVDDTPFVRIRPQDGLDRPGPLDNVEYPCLLKPAEGVASEDVVLVRDRADLEHRVRQIRAGREGDLLVEGLIEGPLHTLETLGDGVTIRVWGGYRTQVSAAPYFIEERLTWQPNLPAAVLTDLLAQLRVLGVGFGACHTEFILTDRGPRIVEVNDRLIGDHCDFAMADVLAEPVFEEVIRVHLGHSPQPAPALPVARCAVVHSVLADRDGVLREAPARISRRDPAGLRLDYWPVLLAGSQIRVTGTNRDYLGIVRAIGPDQAAVEAGIAQFLADQRWVIG